MGDAEVGSSAIYYMMSFLVASEGLALLSANPHLRIVKVSDIPQMHIELAYNAALIIILSFALGKASRLFGVLQNTYRSSSLVVDLGMILGLQLCFYEQPPTIKSAIYSIFLLALYLKAICSHLPVPFAKMAHHVSEGTLYSIFVVLGLKIPLLGALYGQSPSDHKSSMNSTVALSQLAQY